MICNWLRDFWICVKMDLDFLDARVPSVSTHALNIMGNISLENAFIVESTMLSRAFITPNIISSSGCIYSEITLEEIQLPWFCGQVHWIRTTRPFQENIHQLDIIFRCIDHLSLTLFRKQGFLQL